MTRSEPSRLKLLILAAVTAVLAGLVLLHVNGINGPDYWQWPWRARRGVMPYLILTLPAIPVMIAQLRYSKLPAVGIALMMFSMLGMELAVRDLDTDQHDLTRLAAIIEEPGSIGYFTHAREFVESGKSIRQFLGDFPAEMLTFTKHARNKPPGSILFFVPFVKGSPTEDAAAMSAGLAIAVLATLSVPATYLLVRELTGDRDAAFQAAACMTLCPGLSLFLPEFDQFFPIYSCAMLILWVRALKTGRMVFALAFGILFSFVCFQTFNLLLLGIFVAGYAGIFLLRDKGRMFVVVRQSVAVIMIFTAVYSLLWLWSGYDPIKTLITGVHTHQIEEAPILHRDWPRTIPFDLTDFALGTGWVCVLLAVYHLARVGRGVGATVLLCLLQPVAVAVTGLLQGETARVWIFMYPLLLVPAGLELRGWRPSARVATMACLWLVTVILSQNMVFV